VDYERLDYERLDYERQLERPDLPSGEAAASTGDKKII
jgi:hypothetical protein